MRANKKFYPNGVAHPAVYSNALLPVFEQAVFTHYEPTPEQMFQDSVFSDRIQILDPFAGTGRIHELPFRTVGVELEPEWAELHPSTIVGNALQLPFADESFDVICTSPTYGNRMADHHNAKDGSVRRSYKHDIGRDLHPDNTGQMHWGDQYRAFHGKAWTEAVRVLRPGGLFILNCKNHIRAGKEQHVTEWHVDTLSHRGLTVRERIVVGTPGMRYGANRRRLEEWVVVLEKPQVSRYAGGMAKIGTDFSQESLISDTPKL